MEIWQIPRDNLETARDKIKVYRKSHTGLGLVPKSVTLDDIERRNNGRYFALFYWMRYYLLKLTTLN